MKDLVIWNKSCILRNLWMICTGWFVVGSLDYHLHLEGEECNAITSSSKIQLMLEEVAEA